MGLDNWQVTADGMPYRRAARVCALSAGRLLLVRGHDFADPTRQWWFTIGGGLDQGESPEAAACRELCEETGLKISPDQLIGPVIVRRGLFRFKQQPARQDELFYIVHLPDECAREGFSYAGWTSHERDVLDELKWFTHSELVEEAKHTQIYPPQLVDLFAQWLEGWDGQSAFIDEISASAS